MKAILLFLLLALSGCERYEKMGPYGGTTIVQDRFSGKLYIVTANGLQPVDRLESEQN